MPRAVQGVLVKCDESIKAILVKIDADHNHDFIIENVDKEHLLIQTKKQELLKELLKEALRAAIKDPSEAGSESDN